MASEPMVSKIPLSDIDDERWNKRSNRRTEVLSELKAVLKEIIGREQVPPPFWAFCQTADISKLEEMIYDAKRAPDAKMAKSLLEPTVKDCDMMIDRWLQNTSTKSSTTSGSVRSSSASNNCKRRDNDKCVLTRWSNPEAAHIYPYCLITANQREPRAVERFWDLLEVFWEKDRVESWKTEIFRDSQNLEEPSDTCSNMICLEKRAHALWDAGRFALRPVAISPDHKAMQIEFYWQKKPSYGNKEIDLLKAPATSEGLYDYDGGEGLPVATGKRKMDGQPEYGALISGQVITLTTDDVAKRPLPSWPLLELQWHLQRVAGMSGAAEARDEVDRNDDGDDGELVVLDRDAAVNRVTSISKWLQQLPDNEQIAPKSRPSIPV
ncbi:hypothetical protein AJ79_03002 [Helicocarpus griseus UAMH5409]|uniref:HNH nuclease domain-containing protein n=1 Tax=Helicocarpus griseus UAMH5409 TaxID=1447875 RepID=A0A2B7Y011_9EURO|nr:hypothetical protein AJ79_03002 [Helicocarpus griseus UAMH5409]